MQGIYGASLLKQTKVLFYLPDSHACRTVKFVGGLECGVATQFCQLCHKYKPTQHEQQGFVRSIFEKLVDLGREKSLKEKKWGAIGSKTHFALCLVHWIY